MPKSISRYNPTFNPIAGTLNFGANDGYYDSFAVYNNGVSFEKNKLYAIINVALNQIIYAPNSPSTGGVLSGQVLTLTYDTSSQNSSDPLMIIYDIEAEASTEATLSTLNGKVTACDTGTVNNKKSTGFSYGVNRPTLPNVGADFGAGIYAGYVLIATVPANSNRLNVDIENLSGAPIVIIRDDGTAGSGAAPNNPALFALEGYYGVGRQGSAWSSNTFTGRLQVYSSASSPQVEIMED